MAAFKNAKQLADHRKKVAASRPETRKAIAVCAGTGCKAFGSYKLLDAFNQ
jgi:NADH:ubiquinone oxidoreductase subunit E